MHICQDELAVVGWLMQHLRLGWAYVAHAWHWVRRHRRLVHEDGCCSAERHGELAMAQHDSALEGA